MPGELKESWRGSNNFHASDLWDDLYPKVRKYVAKRIRRLRIPYYLRQEYDIIEDVVQHTVSQVFIYLQKVERGEVPAIIALYPFSRQIARNHIFDLLRKSARLLSLEADDEVISTEIRIVEVHLAEQYNPIEEKLRTMILASAFVPVAEMAQKLSRKQRLVLLIDLARHSDFADEPTPLEQAFAQFGIALRDYQFLRPTDKRLLASYTSSLCLAYKKLSAIACPNLRESDFFVA